MNIVRHLPTKSKSKGVNTCEFIMLHHTGTPHGSLPGVLNTLADLGRVSCHYVVDTNGDLYKIGEDRDILWHAGESKMGTRTGFNRYSIGIEIIGPNPDGTFTDAQRLTVGLLVQELALMYKIPQEKIIRHLDVSGYRGKWDVSDTFWNRDFPSWEQYRKSIFLLKPMPSKYTDIMNTVIQETGFEPLFERHEGDNPLSEQETRELIEIAFARFSERFLKVNKKI